jgi:glycine/D-amino acid oxidase-like deaminating enzyme
MASDEETKNIVIIGGGIIGCTSAYFLTRHPSYDPSKHKITLLESTKIAGGASGKAGGLLALWAYPSSIVPLSYRLHKQLAEEHNGEQRWGYRAVHCAQVECDGRDVPAETAKTNVAGKDDVMSGDNSDVKENVSLQKRSNEAMAKLRAAGVPPELDWVHPDGIRTYDEMSTPTDSAQVHPYQFTTSMAELAKEKGASILEDAPVTNISYAPDGQTVTGVTYTHDGTSTTVPATDIVLAAGPWTRSLYPDAPITGLRAHSVTIRPSRPVSAYALFTQIRLPSPFGRNPARAGQIVTPEIYARPHGEVYACGDGDHELALPATTAEVAVDARRCQDVVDFVSAISPELAAGEVTARQACYLPNVTGSGSPLIGRTHVAGLWLAAGHTCWGIQNGPASGKLVSEFVFEGEARSAEVQGLDPRGFLG